MNSLLQINKTMAIILALPKITQTFRILYSYLEICVYSSTLLGVTFSNIRKLEVLA